jgi:SAM-dependent methyltransferase
MTDRYIHGHHESVLRSHTWRTVENSAAYLVPHLRPGQDLLDVGCGPGSITVDLARRVAPGRVVGIDRSGDVVEQASEHARAERVDNVTFAVGDVYALDVDDASFDVVHAHQVTQHLTDPVAALAEMRRVVRSGGVVAARDSDYASVMMAPDDPWFDRWVELYDQVSDRNGAEAGAGRYLLGWAQRAGFSEVTASSSSWTFADPESRAWWGALWADRVRYSSFAEQAVEYGLSSTEELEAMAEAWRRWVDQPDGFFAVTHGEILARP